MGLFERIDEDLREALKKRDELRTRTLRMVKSDITYEKTKGSGGMSEDKVLEIVARAARKRKEAIEEFRKAGREDLAGGEAQELAVIEAYLPAQLSEAEIAAAVEKKISEMGEITKKDFGKLMGAVMKELKGQADGQVVKAVLTKRMESL